MQDTLFVTTAQLCGGQVEERRGSDDRPIPGPGPVALMTGERPRRVVVIGGGFAGTRIARRLERTLPDSWEIFLLSPSNVITYSPLLPEVVGGALLPGHVAAPTRLLIKRTRIRMVSVDRIDAGSRTVSYRGVVDGSLDCEHIVIAAGRAPLRDAVPGMAGHALPLKSLGDALRLRNRVIRRLEEATLTENPERRRALLSFVVIGGGFSGVETAGEIHDLVMSARGLYRNLDPEQVRVVLVHSRERLLPEIHERLGAYAQRRLAALGVEIRLQRRAVSMNAEGVELDNGEYIAAQTLVSTVGTTTHPFIEHSDLPLLAGRIVTDGCMRVTGRPGVWAAGDCAWIPNAADQKACPPTAQFAVRQADRLADNLRSEIEGKSATPFHYRPIGQLAAIGHCNAVAQLGRLRLRGLPAWLLWRAIYVLKIPTWTAKVRVFLEWTWAMFFRRDLGYLDFGLSSADATHGKPLLANAAADEAFHDEAFQDETFQDETMDRDPISRFEREDATG